MTSDIPSMLMFTRTEMPQLVEWDGCVVGCMLGTAVGCDDGDKEGCIDGLADG